MPETSQEAYDRGVDAGRIGSRLDAMDKHFRVINGSVADTARELHTLAMQVQRLADQAVADATARVGTAAAVEKARMETAAALEAERRARLDRSDTAWSPVQRASAIVAGLAALIAVLLGIKALLG